MPRLEPEDAAKLIAAGAVTTTALAKAAGVSRGTARVALARAQERARVEKPKTMGKAATAPRRQQGQYTWDLERIRTARDEQLRGQFALPVRLAEAMRTDDALFTAYQARVATQSAISLGWSPADSDHGRMWGARAATSIDLPQHVRESILGTMANHGVAIGYNEQKAIDTDAGPTIQLTLTEWPLEHVRFDASTNELYTRTDTESRINITHGDGRWVVFRKFGVAPWTQDAAVLPAAFLWAMHGNGLQSWAGAAEAHGRPSIIGELPEGVGLTAADGGLTVEAEAMLAMLQAVISGASGAGVRPAGSKVDYLANGSNAWQVFKELAANRESAAARIYLGTDAILGSRGGAPGVDVAALFGIATTRIQGDLEALERGFREGCVEPWFEIHGADLLWVPHVHYEMPDIDADKRAEQEASAIERLAASVKSLKDSGIEVSQPVMNELRRVLGVAVPANLATQERAAVPLALAPTDVARVVKVREARASQGLPALGDERDEMFISELEAPAPAAPTAPTSFSKTRRATRMWAAGYDWREGLAAVNEIRQEPVDGDGDGVLNEEEKEIEKARQKFLGAYEKFVAKQQKADGEIGRLREAKAAHVAEVNAAIAEKDDKKQKKAQRLVDSLDNKIDRESFRREDTDAIGGAFEKYSGALGKQANEAEEVRDDIKLRLDASPDDPELQKGFAEAEAKFQEKSARSEAMRPLEDKVMGTPKKAAESADVHEIAKAIQVGPKGGRYYLAPSGGKVYLTRSRRLWADVDGDGIDDGYYLDENGKKVRPQDHPDLVAARKQIEKARRAYEKKLARYEEKKAPLTKDLDAAETAFTAAEDKQAAALNARDDADSAVDEAESAVEEHHAMIAELRREDPERLEQPLWLDDHEQPINGHQALAQAERDAPTVEADVPAAKAAAKQADREATAAEKEYAKAERHRDNLAWKEENLSLPDTDDVERAQEEYADTSREIAAEHREAGDEVAAKAFDDHAAATEAEITDPSTLAAPGVESAPNPAAAEPDAPAKPDDPYAIQIGPSGGRYYLAPSGQKVYLQ